MVQLKYVRRVGVERESEPSAANCESQVLIEQPRSGAYITQWLFRGNLRRLSSDTSASRRSRKSSRLGAISFLDQAEPRITKPRSLAFAVVIHSSTDAFRMISTIRNPQDRYGS